jgi:hypothetical protein
MFKRAFVKVFVARKSPLTELETADVTVELPERCGRFRMKMVKKGTSAEHDTSESR